MPRPIHQAARPSTDGGPRERLQVPFELTPHTLEWLNRTAATHTHPRKGSSPQLPDDIARDELERSLLNLSLAPRHNLGRETDGH